MVDHLPFDPEFNTNYRYAKSAGPQSSCEGKVKIPNRSQAAKHAAHMGVRENALFCAYECTHCGAWHVGHDITTA